MVVVLFYRSVMLNASMAPMGIFSARNVRAKKKVGQIGTNTVYLREIYYFMKIVESL
jgi:hypothetical protein